MTSMRDSSGRGPESRWIGAALRDFPWVHLGLGLMGNTMFVVGSVMFFWESVKTLAIWFFVLGSLGMLLGSVGELLVRVEKRRRGDDEP